VKGIEGGLIGEETVYGRDLWSREEDGDVSLAGGSHTSARGGEEQGTGLGCPGGPWASSEAGPKWCPRPFYLFFFLSSFSFFLFSFSSIDFAF
jgi:hypothetical protein